MSSPYDNFAKYYDGWFIGPILKPYHKNAVKFISPYIKKNSAVLDVGCGTGAFLKQLVKKNKSSNLQIFGIDESKGMIKRALKKKIPNANFQIAQAESIPFPNDYFDLITCVDSFYYLNSEKFFTECRRVLKPGGLIFIDTISIDHYRPVVKPLLWFFKLFSVGAGTKHLKFEKMEALAKDNAFNVVQARSKNFPFALFCKTWQIIFKK
ncbi:MAG: class I SAM-dependent methyltransferase [bacterium]|nr:class I SAM-dependent methyltransferase [bacterium]